MTFCHTPWHLIFDRVPGGQGGKERRSNYCMYQYHRARLILIGERFSIISQVWKYLEICINIRRRSVTIREILQKQKKTSSLNFTYYIWKKTKQENMKD